MTLSKLIRIVMQHPKSLFWTMAFLTLFATAAMFRVKVDTDPQNMLPPDQVDRLFHNQAKQQFALHDMLVVGVVNEKHPQGVFNPQSLANILTLNDSISQMEGVITPDLFSPATVDKVVPEGAGTVRFSRLLEKLPQNDSEALAIHQAAMRLPMLKGSMVTENQKAVALYVPLQNKTESHQISNDIKEVFANLPGSDRYFIAGLPVAEDTFGVEMFTQMAISAPLAALVIFMILFWFFRSVPLILAPMLLSFITVIWTMGALIGMGYTMHIMSSMIPIFLMPIAVVNSVHILSEFSTVYQPGGDRIKTMQGVLSRLFSPMFFTSLTTMAGFGSLVFASIPPVRVFGSYIALGVLLSFLLSLFFLPAWVMGLSEKTLKRLPGADKKTPNRRFGLANLLPPLGAWSTKHSFLVIAALGLLGSVAAYGVTQININDNPVRWFKEHHQIRIADRELNKHFSGTYPAYVVLSQTNQSDIIPQDKIVERLRKSNIKNKAAMQATLSTWFQQSIQVHGQSPNAITALIDKLDNQLFETEDPTLQSFFEDALTLLEKAQTQAKFFQAPQALAYIQGIQEKLNQLTAVGKTTSLADVVRTLNRDLHDGSQKHFVLPKSSEAVAQALLTYLSSHRPQDLWHFVTKDMNAAAIWVQLKSGDNQTMKSVVAGLDGYLEENPPPAGVSVRWAGMTYLNVVWQEQMVTGMLYSLLGSFGIVLIMMIFLFRSVRFGLLSMLPLSFTILFIYGLIGLFGRDYDMPIAVLSAMTLGLSIDFAIHFLQRVRRIQIECHDWNGALKAYFQGPAQAIGKNAIVIAIGFLPLLAAPLVPYNTVGIFMAAIMITSSLVTLVLLPALVRRLASVLPTIRASGVEAQTCQPVLKEEQA